jgi:hypothetical protein
MPRYDDDFDDNFRSGPPVDGPASRREPRRDDDLALDVSAGSPGLGIASLVIGLLVGISMAGLIVIAGVMSINAGGNLPQNQATAVGCLALLGLGLALMGSIFGLVGVIGRYRGKVVAAIGLTINALILLGTVGLIILGLLAG